MTAVSDSVPGATVRRLQVGPLAFTALEMGAGPLVLLLHGFPDGPETWRGQLPALAEAGYRAVAVTLRGYERSSLPPDGRVRVEDLAADVFGWMDALGEARGHLIGHDWGATIAYAAAKLRPERVLSLSMLAVPQPLRLAEALGRDRAQMRRSSYIAFFQLRGLADAWVGRNRAAFVERLWRKWSPGWPYPPAMIRAVRARFTDPDVRRTALDYYRQAADRSDRSAVSRRLLAPTVDVPALGLFGKQDGCISAAVFRNAMNQVDFPLGLDLACVEGAGHFLHVEDPAWVNARLLSRLRSERLVERGPA